MNCEAVNRYVKNIDRDSYLYRKVCNLFEELSYTSYVRISKYIKKATNAKEFRQQILLARDNVTDATYKRMEIAFNGFMKIFVEYGFLSYILDILDPWKPKSNWTKSEIPLGRLKLACMLSLKMSGIKPPYFIDLSSLFDDKRTLTFTVVLLNKQKTERRKVDIHRYADRIFFKTYKSRIVNDKTTDYSRATVNPLLVQCFRYKLDKFYLGLQKEIERKIYV